MKSILCVLIACMPLFLFAQKTEISKDGIVSYDKKEVFKIEGKMGMINTYFTVSNLNGDVLIHADGANEKNKMVVTFTGMNASLDYPLTIGIKKVFAKELAQMQVIKDDQLNPDGVKRLLAKYNGRAERDLILTDNNTRNTIQVNWQPTIINRNKNAILFINKGKIEQDNQTIGLINHKEELSEGNIFQFFTITDLEGNQIAQAQKNNNSSLVSITTYNNKNIQFDTPQKSINIFDLEKSIVKKLIQEGYL